MNAVWNSNTIFVFFLTDWYSPVQLLDTKILLKTTSF